VFDDDDDDDGLLVEESMPCCEMEKASATRGSAAREHLNHRPQKRKQDETQGPKSGQVGMQSTRAKQTLCLQIEENGPFDNADQTLVLKPLMTEWRT
jgi:hypothetical protein